MNSRTQGATVAASAVALTVALGVLPLLVFAWKQGGAFSFDAYTWRVLRFTILQAGLSALLSVLLALPLALLLARQPFVGRRFLLSLLPVPQSVPAIVAIVMMIGLFGQSGAFAGLFNMYSLAGILLVHLYFNIPLAFLVLLQTLEDVAPETERLANQLGFSRIDRWRLVIWPNLKPIIWRVSSLIFLLCASSFVVVLTLGGPTATTLDVAIYQSLRMDFDVTRALSFALIQIALSASFTLLAGTGWTEQPHRRRMPQTAVSPHTLPPSALLANTAASLPVFLICAPLAGLVLEGIWHLSFSGLLLRALLTSLCIALPATLISLFLAWFLAAGQARSGRRFSIWPLAGVIVPPSVLGTGWFILSSATGGSTVLTLCLIVLLNVLMALPFATALLAPQMAHLAVQQDRLCEHLGMRGVSRFRIVEWPILRGSVTRAAILAFALSLGDLSAVTLLGNQDILTLPALISLQLGSYRGDDAMGTALVLAIICLVLGLLAAKTGEAK